MISNLFISCIFDAAALGPWVLAGTPSEGLNSTKRLARLLSGLQMLDSLADCFACPVAQSVKRRADPFTRDVNVDAR